MEWKYELYKADTKSYFPPLIKDFHKNLTRCRVKNLNQYLTMFQRYSRYHICIFKTQNIFGTTSISQLTKREGLQISQLNIASREKSRVVEIRLKPVFH